MTNSAVLIARCDDTCHDVSDAATADPKQPSNHSEPHGSHKAHLQDKKREDSKEDGDHGVQNVIAQEPKKYSHSNLLVALSHTKSATGVSLF